MNKLSKEKRSQLILVVLGTIGVIAGLWFGVISFQKAKLDEVAKKIKSTQQQLDKMHRVVTNAERVKADLKTAGEQLAGIEHGMASGDLFSWIVSAIKQFNLPSYKVDMPQFGPPSVGEVTMLPGFPYRQAVVAVGGSAYYYDFGKFLADFENHFPYVRVQNLSLEPNPNPEEREKLIFRMEIATLIKPSAP